MCKAKSSEVPDWCIGVGKCKDCKAHMRLNKYGRCEECQVELQDQIEQAEADAGWDPKP